MNFNEYIKEYNILLSKYKYNIEEKKKINTVMSQLEKTIFLCFNESNISINELSNEDKKILTIILNKLFKKYKIKHKF